MLTCTSLPGNSEHHHSEDHQARYIEAAVQEVLVTSIYLPNGNPHRGPKFNYKLAWFERLIARATDLMASGAPVALAGDYNVVPTPQDNRVIVPRGGTVKGITAKPLSLNEINRAVILEDDFESPASASSAIPALGRFFYCTAAVTNFEYAHAGCGFWTGAAIKGNSTRKTAPLPGRLSTVMEPWCCVTIQRAIARPRPAPPCSRLRALSTR